MSIKNEAELLDRIGGLVTEYIAEHGAHERDALVIQRSQFVGVSNRLSDLTKLIDDLGVKFHVNGGAVEELLVRIVQAARRCGHDEGFIAGLDHACKIVVRNGNPTSTEIYAVIKDFDEKREKYNV